MSWFYGAFLRPALFARGSEEIHDRTLAALARLSGSEVLCDLLGAFYGPPPLPVELFGLRFPNPVGLAAGMDKQATTAPVWPSFGFGFSELGGVTWHAQAGNPAPRLFRVPSEEALINRMGFNNPGAEAIAATLAHWKALGRWPGHPVGLNLGKSRITPLDKAAEDYANSFRCLRGFADFFVVNVSSPNTANLRQLQDKAALDEILAALQEMQDPGSKIQDPRSQIQHPDAILTHHESRITSKPILVKVSPDLSFEALDDILELAGPRRLAGIVATNTTVTRPETNDATAQRLYGETGGLSGKPLRARSTEVIRHIYRQTEGRLPIIGVGGIFTAGHAWEKITAGASLVQVYTGLVYEGPGLARKIVEGLRERMAEQGMLELREAVGSGI